MTSHPQKCSGCPELVGDPRAALSLIAANLVAAGAELEQATSHAATIGALCPSCHKRWLATVLPGKAARKAASD
jgi:hypothetical protein